jgi:hypothetical protein
LPQQGVYKLQYADIVLIFIVRICWDLLSSSVQKPVGIQTELYPNNINKRANLHLGVPEFDSLVPALIATPIVYNVPSVPPY